MGKIIKFIVIAVLGVFGIIILFFGSLALAVVIQGSIQEKECFEDQIARVAALEDSYKMGAANKVDEGRFADFDINDIDTIPYNRLRTIGTHNSYKKKYSKSAEVFTKIVFPMAGSGANESDYAHENFTDQLNVGLRTFELDIAKYTRNGEEMITATHAPFFDGNSWAIDFSLALKEIAMWSRYNPEHMPITILLEIKTDFLLKPGVKKLSGSDIALLNNVIADSLGDRLFTPVDMRGEYPSLKELRTAGGYPTLNNMKGKIMCLLHPSIISDEYNEAGIEGAKMFVVGAHYEDAIYALVNDPNETDKIKELVTNKYIVRTRMNIYSKYIEEHYDRAIACNAQILSSDYVPRVAPNAGEYVATFRNGKTMALTAE